MSTVLFLHDTSLETPRGAELTIKQLLILGIKNGYKTTIDNLNDFDLTKNQIANSSLVIVNSTSRCHYEIDLLNYIINQGIPFIKIEYDYNFCIRRNILCTIDKKITNCCNNNKFHTYRKLFANANLNIFQSPKHYQLHFDFYGEAIRNHLIMPPTVDVESLQKKDKKNEDVIPFFGDLNYLKGGYEFVEYANNHPEKVFVVYGNNYLKSEISKNVSFKKPISNKAVLKLLGKTKTIFCKPIWPEPSGRLAAEAFLSGCEIISNDRIGTFSFDFYPNSKKIARQQMAEAPQNFWNAVDTILKKPKNDDPKKLGKVLVYKSYGGLGDIFFAIPAINKLAEVSEELHFAVAPRLVSFFTKHLKQLKVVDEKLVATKEFEYDDIYELGNYPAFRGYSLPHALHYPTHKKVKQHAIKHYIDAVAKLHISINNTYEGYSYFERKTSPNKKYFVVHHGAGFLLKIWPTEKYALLIERLLQIFPHLHCKIIQGPNDPEISSHFTKPMPEIELITGGMEAVGKAMASALFHIGNDAGITHVAGAYNVPTIGIYGPTGPGSWGSFSEINEVIWGKKEVCDIRCNYDVILNCDHKICLNSITINRVIEAVYKVTQQLQNTSKTELKINPQVSIDFSEKDCLITLYDNEFLLEYHHPKMNSQVELLLKESTINDEPDETFKTVLNVLYKQNIIFKIPTFK